MAVDYERYVKAHREREAALAAVRLAEGWRVARAAAAILRGEFGARRVLAFGSLVRGRMRTDSDVDLAVEGLDVSRYFDALARVQGLGTVDVQIAPLERSVAHIRDAALREGVDV